MNECDCGNKFPTKLAPCPDGREGCCVAHFDKDSYRCPACGKDWGPEIAKAIMEGRVTQEPGIAVINMEAVKRLELARDEGPEIFDEVMKQRTLFMRNLAIFREAFASTKGREK